MSEPSTHNEIETALLRAIRQFFEERAALPAEPVEGEGPIGERTLQLATTVLFLQIIAADHESRHDEHEALVRAVARVLRIDGDAAARIIRVGEEHIKTPLPTLLRLLKDRCTKVQRKSVIESLWQLAYADAELAGHEEYFVRKVALSLDLSTADLVETKILAREAFLDS